MHEGFSESVSGAWRFFWRFVMGRGLFVAGG